MPYRALYRQWRPRDFSHMVGQKPIIETLRNQVVHDRIAHAYLFCGSRGTGKTSTAKILAKAINCDHPREGDPCGECPNCLRMEREESLDIIEIDAASNNGVDEMRDLRDTVKYPPQFGRYKVYIIDEVHMLSTSAFNALLKTLEEPPAHIVFILATTEPQKLPETILSRCQRFDFGRIATADIASRLREASEGAGARVTDGALMTIARAAEGGMRDALSILDMCLGYGDHIDEAMVRRILGTCDSGFMFRFGDALAVEEAGTVFHMIDEMMRDGRDPGVFSKDVSHHIRCLLLAKCCPDEIGNILDLTEDTARDYIGQAGKFSVSRLMRILDLFMALETEMRFSASPRVALENTSLKCCIRTQEPDAQALYDRIGELEKKIEEMGKQIRDGVPVATAGPVSSGRTEHAHDEKKQDKTPAGNTVAESPVRKPAGGDAAVVWDALMKQYQKTDPGIWSMLTHGKMIGAENDVFLWQPNTAGDQFFVTPLSREGTRKKIGETLTALSGRPCHFGTASTTGPAKKDDSDQAYISRLYETFGREPVIVKEEL